MARGWKKEEEGGEEEPIISGENTHYGSVRVARGLEWWGGVKVLSHNTYDDRQAYRGVGSVDRLDSDCRLNTDGLRPAPAMNGS